jgi:hypothetical protein
MVGEKRMEKTLYSLRRPLRALGPAGDQRSPARTPSFPSKTVLVFSPFHVSF